MKRTLGRAALTALLGLVALTVWWPLWFLLFGALTPADELAATIGPALGQGAGQARWQLLPSWPTLQPLAGLLLDTPQFSRCSGTAASRCSRSWPGSSASAHRRRGRFPACGSGGGGG